MAEVTAAMVKSLRETSGAGMMDCKKALAASDGDMDKAVEYLREKGLAAAGKKADRIAAEGVVATLVQNDKKAVIVEINSETDFVARNEIFKEYVSQVAKQLLNSQVSNAEEFLKEKWALDTSKTVEEELSTKISVIGEKLTIRRFERLESDGIIVDYLHGGGRIGVLVEAKASTVNDEIKEALRNIAMQIAALSPQYLKRDEVSQTYLDSETEILTAQAKNESPDKPDKVIQAMISGRLKKQLKEICLLDQDYVKDGDLTVAAYLAQVAKSANSSLELVRFVRFETGEGLEKKTEDFAEEVKRQISGK
ncbi:elongation factor Ts [Clostridia bacterium]|nr:elongation factor Ts [Clostridia bacterium]